MRPDDHQLQHNPRHLINKYLGQRVDQTHKTPGNQLPLELIQSAFSKTNHKAIRTPRAASPFHNKDLEAEFLASLTRSLEECEIPEGYGVLKAEWRRLKGKAYPSTGSIIVGARKQKYDLRMPVEVWLPRAQKWAIGLDLLERFLHVHNMNEAR
ncbi:hypothetical protein FRC12_004067 [Ceratobasidium sp. 428]|nr:hypothetical protein FRC12_004067 [Ceratobasidium sp. 428]